MRDRPVSSDKQTTARILNVQRMSTEDGPGIRTTVFFKGCGLSCPWCHNPESISHQKQLVWNEPHCIRCCTCVATCPIGALASADDGISVDRDRCTLCGDCVDECPTGAMELLGQDWTLPELVAEVVKDRAFFERSGGGVTVSGGEPALQAGFVEVLLEQCRSLGLHTALDTCGFCGTPAFRRLLRHTDLVLYDLKLMDPTKHEEYTGQSNRRVLENLAQVREVMVTTQTPSKLWIRTPLIPTATADDDNIRAIGGYLADNLGELVDRWELCAFNNLCRAKYARLHLDWPFEACGLHSRAELDHFEEVARKSGVDPDIVSVTGAAKVIRNGDSSWPASRQSGE